MREFKNENIVKDTVDKYEILDFINVIDYETASILTGALSILIVLVTP